VFPEKYGVIFAGSHWQCCNLDRSTIVNSNSERSESFLKMSIY